MANIFSSASEPQSSLQASDGGGAKSEVRPRMETEGKKLLLELQTLYDRSLEDNQSLAACKLVLEEKHREYVVLLEDKDEEINKLNGLVIELKEGAKSMSGTVSRLNKENERLKVKYRKRVEAFEFEERKWREEEKRYKEKCLLLEVEKGKMEIDLQVERNGSGDVVEKMKRMLEEKDFANSELMKKVEMVVKQKRKVEEELNERVINLEKVTADWLNGNVGKSVSPVAGKFFNVHGKSVSPLAGKVFNVRGTSVSPLAGKVFNVHGTSVSPVAGKVFNAHGKSVSPVDGKVFNVNGKSVHSDVGVACPARCPKGKGTGDLQKSGPRSVGTPLLQPKEEIIEADVQVKGNDRKEFFSMVSDIKKEVTYAPKSTDSVVQISDDEDENEEEKEKEAKHTLPVPTSSTSSWLRKRKFEALISSAEKEKQAETSLFKSNAPQEGKLWESADKMLVALVNSNLCLKSICALYRKHSSLGVWKNRRNVIEKPLSKRGMDLGKRFTRGDLEGRMNKEASDSNRIDDDTMMECRSIVRLHYKELFEIYNNDMDPLFQP